MKKEGSIVKNTIILVIMTLILGAILGSIHYITEAPIAKQNQQKHDQALKTVFESAKKFDAIDLTKDGLDKKIADTLSENGLTTATINEISEAKDASGEILGYVFTVTSSGGYGGDIQFTLGIDNEGTIKGISYLILKETAGLGMRAANESFINQFVGKKVEMLKVTKSGAKSDDEIDALSGSTITTNAVVVGVNAGLKAFALIAEGGNS